MPRLRRNPGVAARFGAAQDALLEKTETQTAHSFTFHDRSESIYEPSAATSTGGKNIAAFSSVYMRRRMCCVHSYTKDHEYSSHIFPCNIHTLPWGSRWRMMRNDTYGERFLPFASCPASKSYVSSWGHC